MANLLQFPTMKPVKETEDMSQLNKRIQLMENQKVIKEQQQEKIQKFIDKLWK